MQNEPIYPVFEVAHVASAACAVACSIDMPTTDAGAFWLSATVNRAAIPNPITNFQLAFWRDALRKYGDASRQDQPNPEDLVLILTALGFSLTFLFGVNFTTSDGSSWTPTMVQMAREWKLHEDNESLFNRYLELSKLFTEKMRHTDAKKIESSLMSLDISQIRRYMLTTRDVWRWFIKEYYSRYGNGIVPDDQLREFQDEL